MNRRTDGQTQQAIINSQVSCIFKSPFAVTEFIFDSQCNTIDI